MTPAALQGIRPMKNSVIWIDRKQARVFHVSDEAVELRQFTEEHPEHQPQLRDRLDREREQRAFFKQVAKDLSATGLLLVIGPGLAKHHFHNFLLEQHPMLGKRVAGIEAVEHPTSVDITALARKYFLKVAT